MNGLNKIPFRKMLNRKHPYISVIGLFDFNKDVKNFADIEDHFSHRILRLKLTVHTGF